MSTLRVDNLLCFEELELDLDPGVTLVTGPNSSGKSCFGLILGALAAEEPNPLGLAATSKKAYIRDGQIEGEAELDGVTWRPPAGISSMPGATRAAVPHSVGAVDFIRSTKGKKDRAQLWEGLFLPDDAETVLRPVWKRPEAQLLRILETIQRQGWEAAQKYYEEQRVECKRRWQSITGMPRYGPKAATTWVPANWTTELEDASEDELVSNLQNLKDQLNLTTVARAITQEKIDEAVHARDTLMPEAQAKITEWRNKVDDLQNKKAIARRTADSLDAEVMDMDRDLKRLEGKLDNKPDAHCPHCRKGLVMVGMSVQKWQEPDPEERDALAKQRDAMTEKLDNKREKLAKIRRKEYGYNPDLEEAQGHMQRAKFEYEHAERQAQDANATANDGDGDGERTVLENRIEEARNALAAFRLSRDATREHENVVELDEVCELLGPNGARAAIMRDKMDEIRIFLKAVHELTGWEDIRLHDDYSISSNGRTIRLCAANEQLKAQWLMQLACAVHTESKWVVMDAADTLKGKAWDGLEKLADSDLIPEGMHLVICGTELDNDNWDVIDLEG